MTDPNPIGKKLAMSSLILGILGILLPILGALGTRAGLWPFGIGLFMSPGGLLLAALGLVLGIIALLRMRQQGARFVLPAHGAALNLLICLYMGSMAAAAFTVPPIHNISTDTKDPPKFTAAHSLRGEDENPLEYDSDAIGPVQREAYPKVEPLIMEMSRVDMYELARDALLDMGMELVREDTEQGELEAVASTFWFGFKDDLIVRLRDVQAGTRMDVRSVSRVGRSDLGANADRILEVIKRVRDSAV